MNEYDFTAPTNSEMRSVLREMDFNKSRVVRSAASQAFVDPVKATCCLTASKRPTPREDLPWQGGGGASDPDAGNRDRVQGTRRDQGKRTLPVGRASIPITGPASISVTPGVPQADFHTYMVKDAPPLDLTMSVEKARASASTSPGSCQLRTFSPSPAPRVPARANARMRASAPTASRAADYLPGLKPPEGRSGGRWPRM
jgi:hypothetical protein